ncbi:hypothetical protein [Yersinia rohdei]|uniref:hypothetical protein n=1 Tax=Yersinia rohdei TaxID=29485 RepID=UPI00119E851C|nr:hypothetical protein [Yersinia rohdei]
MNVMSSHLASNLVDHCLLKNSDEASSNNNVEIKIKGDLFSFDKDKGPDEILTALGKNKLIDLVGDFKHSHLFNLLNSLLGKSLPESMMDFEQVITSGLPASYNMKVDFEPHDPSGVEMYYSVTHNENGCNLFKMSCEFIFASDCQFDNKKSAAMVEYYPQCSEKLKQYLDNRTLMQKIFDWLKSIFMSDINPSLPTKEANKIINFTLSDSIKDRVCLLHVSPNGDDTAGDNEGITVNYKDNIGKESNVKYAIENVLEIEFEAYKLIDDDLYADSPSV